tara:strand:+ start:281 stop:406 length:126 start_codon:yes stop_codon:yes gene_type:complete
VELKIKDQDPNQFGSWLTIGAGSRPMDMNKKQQAASGKPQA